MRTRAVDLTDGRFGRWQVLERAGSDASRNALWSCRCDCGTEKVVKARLLLDGQSTSCGCRKDEVAASRYIDLTGQQFGRWSVLGPGRPSSAGRYWRCRCECGVEREVFGAGLRQGTSTSCGRHMDGHVTHGLSKTPEYRVWQQMWQRCTNPTNKRYPLYGGRGIKVCDRWLDFGVFIEDMGRRPSPDLSLDRIDNDGDYEPGNCRWATAVEQNNNTRRNRR